MGLSRVPTVTGSMRGALEMESLLACQGIMGSGRALLSQALVFGEVFFIAVSNNRQDAGFRDIRGRCLMCVCLFAWCWHP